MDKNLKIILKLNRETKENKIVWEVDNSGLPSSISGTETLLENVYTCRVLERRLRLYKYQHKYYYEEDLFHWIENFRLEFIDSRGKSEWSFPNVNPIYDLYETVRYKTSKIQNFEQDFLKDDSEDEIAEI